MWIDGMDQHSFFWETILQIDQQHEKMGTHKLKIKIKLLVDPDPTCAAL